jgi:molecular chaperone GrpE (heat shock protein)
MENTEYYNEITGLAAEVIEEAKRQAENAEEIEEIARELLIEFVQSHKYAIYYKYHLPILEISENAEYMIEHMGGEEEALRKGGLSGLHAALAFWAVYADAQDEISQYFNRQKGDFNV